MKGNLLLMTLFSKDEFEFKKNLTELLKSRNFDKFTLWDIDNNTVCKSILSTEAINSALFDIYDLGYEGGALFEGETELNYYDRAYPVYASVFCSEDGIHFPIAMTFHEAVDSERLQWLKALSPYLAFRLNSILSGQRQLEIFVDYQKKIDFIKESANIFKSLALKDVIINALNFFNDSFHAEASCVADKDGFIAGIGLTEEDLEHNLFINDKSVAEYIIGHTDTLYITEGLKSQKFNLLNAFLVQDPLSGTIFILFNISGDIVPDKELSALIAHIVSLAIENASFHEKEIEQAEMMQTVEIINKFVIREMELSGYPSGYCVNYPAKTTGGDYSTVIEHGDYTFMFIADVCGKGYAAATLTVMLATMIDSGLFFLGNIARMVSHINSYVLEKNFDWRFITGFASMFKKDSMTLQYVSCGNEPVYIIRGDEITELVSDNLPMGIMDEEYELKEYEIESGDIMFMYSDGVVEYIDYESLKKRLIDLKDLPAKTILQTLFTELVTDPSQQRDDFTCTLIKF